MAALHEAHHNFFRETDCLSNDFQVNTVRPFSDFEHLNMRYSTLLFICENFSFVCANKTVSPSLDHAF